MIFLHFHQQLRSHKWKFYSFSTILLFFFFVGIFVFLFGDTHMGKLFVALPFGYFVVFLFLLLLISLLVCCCLLLFLFVDVFYIQLFVLLLISWFCVLRRLADLQMPPKLQSIAVLYPPHTDTATVTVTVTHKHPHTQAPATRWRLRHRLRCQRRCSLIKRAILFVSSCWFFFSLFFLSFVFILCVCGMSFCYCYYYQHSAPACSLFAVY